MRSVNMGGMRFVNMGGMRFVNMGGMRFVNDLRWEATRGEHSS
jgi:hypothetical protein